jgi:hypothetical protein
VDQLLRGRGDDVICSPVPAGVLPTAGRFCIVLPPHRPELRERLHAEGLRSLQSRLPAPRPWPIRVAGRERPTLERRDALRDPSDLVALLPAAPTGWERVDVMPMYRPHRLVRHPALSEVDAAALADSGLLPTDEIAWSAQAKGWYRGPHGSFALVLRDTGLDERLLRSRIARTETSWEDDGAGEPGVTLRSWSGAGRSGFRTCRPAQGLCEVVVLLIDSEAGEDVRPARYDAILVGPAGASDGAFAELIAAVEAP